MSEPIEIIKSDFQKVVIDVKEYEGHRYIDIRTWTKDDPRYTTHGEDGKPLVPIEWKPSHKGVTIPLGKAGELWRAIGRLFAEHELEKE